MSIENPLEIIDIKAPGADTRLGGDTVRELNRAIDIESLGMHTYVARHAALDLAKDVKGSLIIIAAIQEMRCLQAQKTIAEESFSQLVASGLSAEQICEKYRELGEDLNKFDQFLKSLAPSRRAANDGCVALLDRLDALTNNAPEQKRYG